jgi:hypothetical protein
MKQVSVIIWNTFVIAVLIALGAPAACAQLAMSPTIIEQRSYAGGLSSFTVAVSNTGARTLDCRIDLYGMELQGAGLPVPVENAPRSCKDWLTVQPREFTLSPGSGKKLVCRVRPDKDAGGGYYGIISCFGRPRGQEEGDSAGEGVTAGVRFSYRVMAVLMLTVPGPDMRARIEAGRPMMEGRKGAGYLIGIPVRNRGTIHTRMQGSVAVRSEEGQLVERFPLEAGRGFLLPGHERLFRSRGEINLPDGTYAVRVDLRPPGGDRPMQKAFPFYVRDGQPTVAEATDEIRRELIQQSAGFIVSPAVCELAVRPGGRRTQAVEVRNLTRETLKVRARPLSWERSPSGEDRVLNGAGEHERSALKMLELRQQEVELGPMSRRRVPFFVAMPDGAEGEHYAAITFDRQDVQLDQSPEGRSRRSLLLRARARGTGSTDAEITDFGAERQPNGAISFTARLRNTGTIAVTPQVNFYIDDQNDNRVGKAAPKVRPSFVQAGAEGIVTTEYTQVLDPGDYTAELALRYDPDKPPLIRRTEFSVPAASPAADGKDGEQ